MPDVLEYTAGQTLARPEEELDLLEKPNGSSQNNSADFYLHRKQAEQPQGKAPAFVDVDVAVGPPVSSGQWPDERQS